MLYSPASLQSALGVLCMLCVRNHCHPALIFCHLRQEVLLLYLGLKCALLCLDSPNQLVLVQPQWKLRPFLFVSCTRHLLGAFVSDACNTHQHVFPGLILELCPVCSGSTRGWGVGGCGCSVCRQSLV